MATWLRDDSDLTTAPGINSTTVGTNLTISGNEIDVSSGDLTLDSANNIILDASSNYITMSVDEDPRLSFNLSEDSIIHCSTGKLTLAGVEVVLDSHSDIVLDANGADVFLKENGSTFGSLSNSGSNNLLIKSGTTTAVTFSGANSQWGGTIQCAINSGDGSSENFVVEQAGLLLKRTPTEVRSDLGISDAEIIDWTADQGSTNIHNSNLPDSPDVSMLTINGNANFTSTGGGLGSTTLFFNYTDGSEDAMTLGLRGFVNQDSKLIFLEAATNKFVIGNDSSEDLFEIGSGGTLGADSLLTLNASGDCVLKGDLTVTGGNITNAITFDSGITNAGTISAGTWSGTALVAGKVPDHDDLNGFVTNEHIDWTGASAGTIHATNYTNTTYTVGDGGLTEKNFTTALNTKLTGIATGAEVNVQSDWNSSSGDNQILNKPTIPVDLTSDGAGTVHANNYTDTNTNQLTTFTVSATTDSNATTISQGDDLMFAAGTGITCETTADGTVTITNTVTDTNTDVDVNVANLTARLPQITESVTIGDATDVDVTIAGDLTVSGNTITFGNAESISNIVDGVLYAGSTNEWRVVGADASDTFMSIYEGVTGRWAFGNDDSASNSFVINNGATLGTTGQDFVLNTSGDLTLKGSANFGGYAGFTIVTPSFGASPIVGGGGNDTDISFDGGNKASLTLTDNVTNINFIFPSISGNFILTLKQDGTGSRTVTNFKAFIVDNTLATTTDVSWPSLTAGNHPTITGAANRTSVISIFWDASAERAYGSLILNYL